MPMFNSIARLYEELDEDQAMVSLLQFGVLFLDWTNLQKAAKLCVPLSEHS